MTLRHARRETQRDPTGLSTRRQASFHDQQRSRRSPLRYQGAGTGEGAATLNAYFPGATVAGNDSAFDDARPNVRNDGLEIVFDSNRGGGAPSIYTATRSSLFEVWSEPQLLGSAVNSPAAETRPSLSRDGTRLYFGSSRNPGRSSDIFVATRPGPGRR